MQTLRDIKEYITYKAVPDCVSIINKKLPNFKLAVLKFDDASDRRSHRGGMYSKGPGINLAMSLLKHWMDKQGIARFYEYPAFDDDSVIGGAYIVEGKTAIDIITAHEIAHAAQHYVYKLLNTRCKPHGPLWRDIYTTVRKEFVNGQLGNQTKLKHVYEKQLKEIKQELLARV